MNVIITKSQYQKIVFDLLETLYGPDLTYKNGPDTIPIFSNDGEEIFRVYTKGGKAKGCKKDLLVTADTTEEIKKYVPSAAFRKKLFSKTVISFVNQKTDLNIDCIEFWSSNIMRGLEYETRYNFNVKKNKKAKRQ
jgi:hypothetical protein